MNRIREHLRAPEEGPKPAGDYWEVTCQYTTYYVDAATAARIVRAVTRVVPPRWLAFADVTGARVHVRSGRVECVSECTLAQRTAQRAFHKARRDEDGDEDRFPWELD
jgi:hypothetical protein